MDFDALDALGREILDDARESGFPGADAEQSILALDDSDDDEELELENGFSSFDVEEEVQKDEKRETEGKISSSLPPGLASGVEERLSQRTDRLSTKIDLSGDEKAVYTCLETLEAIFPPKDRKIVLLTSALRPSSMPSRSNSTSLLVTQPSESPAITSLLKVDLSKRMFLSEKSTPPPFSMDLPAALLRDLLVEELKHSCRLLKLVQTVIEPLQSVQKGNSEISRFLAPFSLVASSHLDHTIALAKAMSVEWPFVSQLTVSVFQKWIFVLPLYADLATSLLYNASKIQELTQNTPQETAKPTSESGERDMPLLDVLNEPFNHLPKYQYFIESLLSHEAQEIISTSTEDKEKQDTSTAFIKVEVFSQWCQTLAVLQQSLKYLTKCYHRSDKRCNLRRFIERLGSDAPTTLRNADHHKLIGGHDILVSITDHRRKRRKRGFVAILTDCLVLARCESLSSTIAQHNQPSPSSAASRASMRKTDGFGFDRSSFSTLDPMGPSSSPADAKAAAEALKKAKKAQKEEEKKLKKIEKKESKARSKGVFSRTTTAGSKDRKDISPSTGGGLSSTDATGSSEMEGRDARDSTFNDTFTSSSPSTSTSMGSKRDSTSKKASSPSSSRHSASVRARSISSTIPRGVVTKCPLRFVAMLYFDQLAIQMDAQLSDDSEAPIIIIWACDTKFTIEFEQQAHKEEWLRHFSRNEARKMAKKMGPFYRTLPELYCLPPSGIPTIYDRYAILESFLQQRKDKEEKKGLAESNESTALTPSEITSNAASSNTSTTIANNTLGEGANSTTWCPPFLNYLMAPLQESHGLDYDSIVKCSVPPRTLSAWKATKQALNRDRWWREKKDKKDSTADPMPGATLSNSSSKSPPSLLTFLPSTAIPSSVLGRDVSFEFHSIPHDLTLPVLHEFLSKLAEPLFPSVMLEVIATQWDDEDCTDVRKIRQFISFLPAFNLYTLHHICLVLHQLVMRYGGDHKCAVSADEMEAEDDEEEKRETLSSGDDTQASMRMNANISAPHSTSSKGSGSASSTALSLNNQILVSKKSRPRAGKDSSKTITPLRGASSKAPSSLGGFQSDMLLKAAGSGGKLRSSSEEQPASLHTDLSGMGRRSAGEGFLRGEKDAGQGSGEESSKRKESKESSNSKETKDSSSPRNDSSSSPSSSSFNDAAFHQTGFLAALSEEIENPWSTSGPAVPNTGTGNSSSPLSSTSRLHCACSPLAWLISSAFAPAVMRPFKITGAAPIAVANYIGRLSRFVQVFASLINHTPYIFGAITKLTPADCIASFDGLLESLQGDKHGSHYHGGVGGMAGGWTGGGGLSSTETKIPSGEAQNEDGTSSANSSSGNLTATSEGDVNSVTASSGQSNGGTLTFDPSSRDSIAPNTGMIHSGSNPQLAHGGRKGRDARRATTLFHFDMSGLVTESFSVMEFALLHFALAPPGYR